MLKKKIDFMWKVFFIYFFAMCLLWTAIYDFAKKGYNFCYDKPWAC